MPVTIGLPQNGSISNLQQNLMENPSGNKRLIVGSIVPSEDIEVAPINKDKGTRRHGCSLPRWCGRTMVPNIK